MLRQGVASDAFFVVATDKFELSSVFSKRVTVDDNFLLDAAGLLNHEIH